jgi:hypothetical protein
VARRRRVVILVVAVVVAYGALLFLVRGWQLGLVDAAIGDLRTLVGAQAAYAEAHGGVNQSDLTRLSAPHGESLSVVWSRPDRSFTPGRPAAGSESQEGGVATSSVHGFRAVADASLSEGWAQVALLGDGKTAFCADARGFLCELASIPTDSAVRCPSECRRW